jgi:hypothetical protein
MPRETRSCRAKSGVWSTVRPRAAPSFAYDEQAVTTLRVIESTQRPGFTVDEVADLLEANRHQDR